MLNADGQTDMTKLVIASPNFSNVSKTKQVFMKTLDFNNDSIFCECESRTLLIKIVLSENSIQHGIHHSEDLKCQRTYTIKTRSSTPYEVYFLVACDVVQYGTNFQTFRMIILPPLSGKLFQSERGSCSSTLIKI